MPVRPLKRTDINPQYLDAFKDKPAPFLHSLPASNRQLAATKILRSPAKSTVIDPDVYSLTLTINIKYTNVA